MVYTERHTALILLIITCACTQPSLQVPIAAVDGDPTRELTPEEFVALGGNPDEYGDDMILPKKRNGVMWSTWSKGVIPYVIDNSLSAHARTVLQRAFDHFHQRTCIRWVPRTNQIGYVLMKKSPDQNCNSAVGKLGIRQPINLPDWCINSFGSVVHEMMHAIGFYHEQNRSDRDSYITIYWDNIKREQKHNFNKRRASRTFGAAYDYGSLMHYGATAFSKDGTSYTIVPKNGVSLSAIGQRSGLSQTDIFKINAMYKCSTTGTGTGTSSCTDNNASCGGWAAQGECQKNPAYMTSNCRKSCGLCSGTGTGSSCVDSNTSCGAWAASGECQKNPAYMQSNCQKSCGTC